VKVSEVIKITNKIRKMDKLKSRLFSMLIVITVLFGIGILGTLFLFGIQRLVVSFVLIKWLIAITIFIWLLISVLQIKILLEKRKIWTYFSSISNVKLKQEGIILKTNQLKRMRKTNPNVFKETWRNKQIRLKQEEQQKLDHATV
jgi:Tfp pilus assembly major pilin PilA